MGRFRSVSLRAGTPPHTSFSPVDWSKTAFDPESCFIANYFRTGTQCRAVPNHEALHLAIFHGHPWVTSTQGSVMKDLHLVADDGVGAQHGAKSAVQKLKTCPDPNRCGDLNAL